MASLEIIQIPVMQDNYLYLIHEPNSGETAIVDPAVEEPVIEALEKRGWQLTHIINTHHHWDHTGANLVLKEKYNATVVGAAIDRERIPGIDIAVGEGDIFQLGSEKADIYFVPGHTSGHIAYHFPTAKALFCGDTMFSMGCGRLFEGTAEEMWHSLSKLMSLPDDTQICCAHEYTTANGMFALAIEPNNQSLQARMAEVEALRSQDKPTVPTVLSLEKATNPFLRPDSLEIQETLEMVGAPITKVFAEIRSRKDNF
ncbi:hydroxyacylglutathione hydrolase [Kordiimonas sp. SCSIO 12603]|uniref:hydroxyacylglutathione hydrolase n=1 Tax=Kordiimonas sp. SCSIO 12603 TaxID=2829596 RepID=UPI0021042B35|nr:hydroxyacylglutathione hydrolase [Kordiimonas sp. SCSIO 12603]UTW58396.1 hydroxyacylglutathione hydrolase [Kordiimonas sp. SCSIO 12603]